MKKAVFIIVLTLFTIGSMHAIDLSLGLYGGYFIPSDQSFKNIYGNSLQFGTELGWKLGKLFSARFNAHYQSSKGQLTFSGADTRLVIFPLNLSLRFQIPIKWFVPFISGGAGLYFFRESNDIGTLSDTGFGYIGEAGLLFQLSQELSLDLRFRYDYCKVKPTDMSADIGGIHALVGLVYDFTKK